MASSSDEEPVDRERTCPLLLRAFYCVGAHHNPADYQAGSLPDKEMQIYTWMDATLGEIGRLVRDVAPVACRSGTYLVFALVCPDPETAGRYKMREIGVTCVGDRRLDDQKTLRKAGFTIGDYLDVALLFPNMLRRTV